MALTSQLINQKLYLNFFFKNEIKDFENKFNYCFSPRQFWEAVAFVPGTYVKRHDTQHNHTQHKGANLRHSAYRTVCINDTA
jgi:hypothetical protein